VTTVNKIRSLIALVVLVQVALFLAAAGPDKAPKAKGKAASSTSATLTLPGFHRGG
jgi:hypothetical protein